MTITSDSTDIERIGHRRQEIEREIKDAKLLISALTSEDVELEIAERVVLRLSGKNAAPVGGTVTSRAPSPRQRLQGVVVEPVHVPATKEEEAVSKPPGTPTMPEMIFEALQFAKHQGKSGLGPKEMADYIANKWWSDVGVNSIGPIAWRMMKRGQLVKPSKDSSAYSLPTNETPDVSASGVSGDEGGASSVENQGTDLGRTSGAEPAHPEE